MSKNVYLARVHTSINSEEIIFRSKKVHSHAPNLAKVITLKATTEMMKNATLVYFNQQVIGDGRRHSKSK